MADALRHRWERLCERVGAFRKAEESDLTFEMLSTMYSHPPRAYHNLAHIAHLLGVLDSVAMLAEDADAVEFAIWLHDCVFFAERPDNESRSADAAAMIAGLLGCPADFTQRVRDLIGATRHSAPPARGDASLVADIDLSILAAPREEYDRYRAAIRGEYEFADDAMFRQGRAAFLQRMLDREHVYSTAFFRREYERAARDNMQRELDELSDQRVG
jgi:predicted metal-dependent HD superfamily phosphohydrolase